MMVDTGEYQYHFPGLAYGNKADSHFLITHLHRAFIIHKELEWPITDEDVEKLGELEWTVLDLIQLTREKPEIAKKFYERHVKHLKYPYENGRTYRIPAVVTLVKRALEEEQPIPVDLGVRAVYQQKEL